MFNPSFLLRLGNWETPIEDKSFWLWKYFQYVGSPTPANFVLENRKEEKVTRAAGESKPPPTPLQSYLVQFSMLATCMCCDLPSSLVSKPGAARRSVLHVCDALVGVRLGLRNLFLTSII